MSFNGQRMSHNLYMLDGAESSDRGGGGGSDVMPSTGRASPSSAC